MFAEAFASQQMRDRFFEDAERLIELATLPDPSQRPTASQLRAEMFRMFELEPPPRQASSRKVQVSVWNPRWHLARDNRLAAAGRAPDPEQDRMLDEEEVLTQHVSTADEDVTMPVDLPADGPPPVSRSNLPTQRLPEEVEPAAASAVRAPAARRSGLPTQKLDDEALDVDDLASIRFTQMYRKLTDQEPTPEPVRAAHQGRPSGRPPRPSGRNQPPQRGSSGRQPPPSRGGTGRPPPPPRASRRAPPPPSGRRGPPPPRDRPSGRSPAEEPVPTVPDAGFDPDDPLKGLRVALVDDDRVALAVLGRALKKRGCNVATFQDPEAALESISRDSPNAAIVDMQMPGISGLDLLRRLSRRLNGLPFPLMILSSVEEEGVLKEAFRLGARDYMVKPVTEAELAVKLEKAVKIHHEECPQSVPRELNGFELLEELRRGEVAVVYRAADTWDRYPDVLKAIKVLRPDLVGEPEPLLKLRRELDVLADCDHPGLARVVESGLVGKFLYYVADELPARTLAHEVREGGAFSPDKVIAFLREGADILAHLHQQAFLVGDLSPESFARRDDGRFMLCELGNARRLSGVLRQDEPDLPRSRYGPPELFMEPPQLDLRADVYALGVCALEAHTGKPAVRSRATGAIDVEAVAQGLPRAILPVVTRMVAASPDDRYPDADAVLQDLVRRLRPPRR